ncbi:hypothetical protein THAOC_35582 [Thalassiosira oceanica]|uniref:Helicase-associated domain-containing protein n=1 Tax=Thalassiosira oceanica TaxID=159749 RepID=K0R355_THAOC|nr:hypothetical protein THAOC_35582 [Thalassiosira oceanica]|eukprot:EJK45784.1 hypothetical protein THAOC_35582 [Thalassiosira oceanica]
MDDERNGTHSARRRKETAGLSDEAKAYLTEWLYNDNAPTKASAVAPRMTPPTAPEPPLSATRKLVAVADYGRPPAASLAREPASRAPGSPVKMRKETAAKEEKMAPLLIAKSMAPSEVALTMKEGSVGRRRNNEDKQWDARFKELVNYRSEHGDCDVPEKRDKLGTWASQTVPWETRFNELVQYKAKHGDCNVPESQGQLGRWVHRQRVAYKKNKLLQDRLDRLNDIGFDWTPSMMRSKKRESLPSEQVQSSARNENVSLFDANVESVSVAAGTSGFESNRCVDLEASLGVFRDTNQSISGLLVSNNGSKESSRQVT